jgi:hypothetical protein
MLEHPRGTPTDCSAQHESKERAGDGRRVRFLIESSDFYRAAAGAVYAGIDPQFPSVHEKSDIKVISGTLWQ